MDKRVVLYQDKDLFPELLYDMLASRLSVVPRDALFFDDVFSQVEREVARLHQDMRSAMLRLAPTGLVSASSAQLQNRLQQLRNVYSAAEDGSRQLDLTLDLGNFRPEEIEVRVQDNTLTVRAHHEERDEHSVLRSQFQRQLQLPPGTDVNQLHSSLSKDGVLSIRGPMPQVGARAIPIALEYNNK